MAVSLPRRYAVPAIAAVAAAALTLGVSTPATAATAPATGRATTHGVAKAAAGWLDQQLVGGTHVVSEYGGTKYIDYGNTLGVAFALAAAGVGRSSIAAAVNYVGKHLNAYDGHGGPYGVSDGAIAKAAVAAIVAGKDPNHFHGHHLLTALKTHEDASGNNRGVYSTISTSLITIAEARGARHDGSKFAPSTAQKKFLLLQQCSNGGFSSTVRTAPSSACTADVDATGYALMALQALGGHSTAVKSAAAWLVSQRSSNGAWKSQGGANTDSTGLAVVGLNAAGRSTGRSVAWLRKQQVTDGPTVGAGATRGALKYQGSYDTESSLFATNDGVLGLKLASLATLSAKGASKATPVLAPARASVKKHTVRAGHPDRVSAAGFAAKEKVVVWVGSTKVGSAKSGADGSVTVRFTVPKSAPAGSHRVLLSGHRSGLSSKGSLVVK